MRPYWNWRYEDMPMQGCGWFGLEFLAFVFLAIFLVILYRNHLKNRERIEGPPTALDIAKMRLAKGEITAEEFAAMKDHLQ